MADHNGATIDGYRRAVDILPIFQPPCGCVWPSRAIQGKQLHTFRGYLLNEVAFQPLCIVCSVLYGCIDTGPLAPKDWRETQLRIRTDRWTQ
jgi:hypothetical protein